MENKSESIQKRFGKAIRALRLKKGLSQEELAFRSGIHWTYLSGIERGIRNPSLKNINAIVTSLDVELGEFFSSLSQESDFNAAASKRVRRAALPPAATAKRGLRRIGRNRGV